MTKNQVNKVVRYVLKQFHESYGLGTPCRLRRELTAWIRQGIAKATEKNAKDEESPYRKAIRTGVKPELWPPIVMSQEDLDHFRESVGIYKAAKKAAKKGAK